MATNPCFKYTNVRTALATFEASLPHWCDYKPFFEPGRALDDALNNHAKLAAVAEALESDNTTDRAAWLCAATENAARQFAIAYTGALKGVVVPVSPIFLGLIQSEKEDAVAEKRTQHASGAAVLSRAAENFKRFVRCTECKVYDIACVGRVGEDCDACLVGNRICSITEERQTSSEKMNLERANTSLPLDLTTEQSRAASPTVIDNSALWENLELSLQSVLRVMGQLADAIESIAQAQSNLADDGRQTVLSGR